jgi:hypothetical protein
MTQVFAVWGVFLTGALLLRYRERIIREVVMAYRHCGEVGWGYHRASYWPKGE